MATEVATPLRGKRGFTLVEVLATMLLIGIVMGVMTQGFTAATNAAGMSKHRTEASELAASKLSELLVTSGTQLASGGSLSGNFAPDWPDYAWQATATPWVNDTQSTGLQQLDVVVSWTSRNRAESVTVTGLIYTKPAASSQ